MSTAPKEQAQVQKTEQELMQEFVEKYNALCQSYGLTIIANPAYVKRDDGSYSTVIQMSVSKLPKEEDGK